MNEPKILKQVFEFTKEEKDYLLGKKDGDIVKHKELYKKVQKRVNKYENNIDEFKLEKDKQQLWYMMVRHRHIYDDVKRILSVEKSKK